MFKGHWCTCIITVIKRGHPQEKLEARALNLFLPQVPRMDTQHSQIYQPYNHLSTTKLTIQNI